MTSPLCIHKIFVATSERIFKYDGDHWLLSRELSSHQLPGYVLCILKWVAFDPAGDNSILNSTLIATGQATWNGGRSQQRPLAWGWLCRGRERTVATQQRKREGKKGIYRRGKQTTDSHKNEKWTNWTPQRWLSEQLKVSWGGAGGQKAKGTTYSLRRRLIAYVEASLTPKRGGSHWCAHWKQERKAATGSGCLRPLVGTHRKQLFYWGCPAAFYRGPSVGTVIVDMSNRLPAREETHFKKKKHKKQSDLEIFFLRA